MITFLVSLAITLTIWVSGAAFGLWYARSSRDRIMNMLLIMNLPLFMIPLLDTLPALVNCCMALFLFLNGAAILPMQRQIPPLLPSPVKAVFWFLIAGMLLMIAFCWPHGFSAGWSKPRAVPSRIETRSH